MNSRTDQLCFSAVLNIKLSKEGFLTSTFLPRLVFHSSPQPPTISPSMPLIPLCISTSVQQLAWTKFHLRLLSYYTAGKANGFADKGGLGFFALYCSTYDWTQLKTSHTIMEKFLILMILCTCAGMAITFGPHHSKQKLNSNRV